jgi:hypothetical protein
MPDLIWRLALHPRLGLSLADVLTLPGQALWEAEAMADIMDRLAADADREQRHADAARQARR